MTSLLAFLLLAAPGFHREPPHSLEPKSENGYEDFVSAGSIFDDKSLSSLAASLPKVGDAEWLSKRRELADRCSRAFDLVHTGTTKAVSCPGGPIKIETPYPELLKFRMLTRALNAKCAVSCADGRPDEAARALADGIRMNALVGRCGGMFHATTSEANETAVLKEVVRSIRLFTPQGAQTLQSAIVQTIENSKVDESVDREMSALRLAAARMIDDPLAFLTVVGYKTSDIDQKWLRMAKPERESTASLYLATVQREANETKAILALPESQWEVRNQDRAPAGTDAVVPLITFEDLGKFVVHRLEMRRTRLRLVRLHCLVLSYQWQYGVLPPSLGVFKPEETTDPQTGKPFRYAVTKKQYKLWADDGSGHVKCDESLDFLHDDERSEPPPFRVTSR